MAHNPERIVTARDFAFFALLAAAPLLGYQFGIGNQVDQFPIIGRLSDPDFLAGDFYVDSASGFGPRYYYSLFVSLLTRAAPLPVVVLMLAYIVNLAVGLIAFRGARILLGAAPGAAAIAAVLAVTNSSFSLGLAGYVRFESFQPASIAVPLSLLALSLLIERKRLLAAGAFAASSIFHPLIGVEIAMVAYAACAFADLLNRRKLDALLDYVPSGLLFGALVIAAWGLPAAGMSAERIPPEEFFSILPSFRSPHHYLATVFPPGHYASAAVFIAGFAFIAARLAGSVGADVRKTALIAAFLIVVALCVASALFVDVLHDHLWATAQVFRNVFLLKWIGFLFFAAYAARGFSTRRLSMIAAPVAAVFATGEAQPYMMVAAAGAVAWLENRSLSRVQEMLAAGILLLMSLALAAAIGSTEELARAMLAVASLAAVYALPASNKVALPAAAALTIALLVIGWFNRTDGAVNIAALKPTYSWSDMKGEREDVARWAKANTPQKSLWITPPEMENFRLIGERAIVVDFTSIPFGGLAMREWRRRVEHLYGPVSGRGFDAWRSMDKNYRRITPDALRALGAEYGASHAVIYAATPWPGPVLYENSRYKAVALSAGK